MRAAGGSGKAREAARAHAPASCVRSKLMELAGTLSDEGQLLTALAQNDALGAAMAKFDELAARAASAPAALVQPPSGESE